MTEAEVEMILQRAREKFPDAGSAGEQSARDNRPG
jgi:hypothetical protein